MSTDNSDILAMLAGIQVPKNEALTYTGLLELDSVSIRKLAAHTGINRGTTYDALKKLIGIGLVSVRQNGKREQYTAESPEKIYDIIRERRRDLLDTSEAAKEIIPKLLARSAQPQGKPLVRYFEGEEGIVNILQDILQVCRSLKDRQYVAYSSSPVRKFLYRRFPQFTERRIAEDIHVKVIAVGEGGEVTRNAERKWLQSDSDDLTSSYSIIYGDKIAIISIASNDTPYGVVIEDSGAAAMQRLLFERLWATL